MDASSISPALPGQTPPSQPSLIVYPLPSVLQSLRRRKLEDAYGSLERRVRRRLGGGGAAEALVLRCRERCITESVADSSTCAELMEDLGVSEEEARALMADDPARDA